jgi:hypothetical protein
MKKIRSIHFFIIVLLLQGSSSFSQSLDGQILNNETKSPVAFANVYTSGKGTSSNQLGLFSIRFTTLPNDSVLTFSCLGYETKKLAIKEVLKTKVILLIPKPELLKEVVVSSLTAEEIAQRAGKRLKRNFDSGFYTAEYTLNQFVLDTSFNTLGHCETYGILRHKLLDSLNRYPIVQVDSVNVSEKFLSYDSAATKILNGLVNSESDPLSPFSIIHLSDPINFLIRKNLDDDDFYKKVDFSFEGIEAIENENYLIISAAYERPITPFVTQVFQCLFKINAKDYGVKSALIKIGIKKAGEYVQQYIYSSASYQRIGRGYYLQNLDVLNPIKINPANQFRTKYFSSLEFGDIILKKPPKIKNPIPRQLKAHYLDNNKRKIVKDVHNSYWNAIKNADFIKSPKF